MPAKSVPSPSCGRRLRDGRTLEQDPDIRRKHRATRFVNRTRTAVVPGQPAKTDRATSEHKLKPGLVVAELSVRRPSRAHPATMRPSARVRLDVAVRLVLEDDARPSVTALSPVARRFSIEGVLTRNAPTCIRDFAPQWQQLSGSTGSHAVPPPAAEGTKPLVVAKKAPACASDADSESAHDWPAGSGPRAAMRADSGNGAGGYVARAPLQPGLCRARASAESGLEARTTVRGGDPESKRR